MTTVSTTDYWTARALGPAGMLAVEVLGRRARDQELAERARRMEELERIKPPEPQWVKDVRKRIETNKQNPRVTVGGQVVSEGKTPSNGRTIDFRPEAPARFEIRLLGQTSQRIIDEINWMSQDRVETGGHLYSHYPNRLTESLVCLVTGPGEGTLRGRHSLRLVPAELADHLRRGDFVEAGNWHSHPNDNGEPSTADMEAWARQLHRMRQFHCVAL